MLKKFIKNSYLPPLFLIFICFLLYGNTLKNQYALDDALVITQNEFVQKGINGIPDIFENESFTGFFGQSKKLVEGGRYRPLSIASFAIENQIFGQSPGITHFINLLLFAITCVLIFRLIIQLQCYFNQLVNVQLIAFLSAAIFAVHPIHTEVVANCKGRDELLALLFGLLTLKSIFIYIEKRKIYFLLLSTLYFFLSLLSKENSVSILILFGIITMGKAIKPSGKKNKSLQSHLVLLISLIISFFFYWIIRTHILGQFNTLEAAELMNNPFLGATLQQKYATIFYTLLLYIKLLFVPYPLTFDYYPYHIALQSFTNVWVVLSILLYSSIIYSGFKLLRKNGFVAFFIGLYLIPLLLVSNIFINIGTFMNERFLYFSSLGFCVLLAFYTVKLYNFKPLPNAIRQLIPPTLILTLLVFGVITINRNTQWKDNMTLFMHDVEISAESAKSNCSAGGVLLEKAQKEKDEHQKKVLLQKSIGYLEKSVHIHPTYVDALLLLGNAYFESNDSIEKVIKIYEYIFNLAPKYPLAAENFKIILGSGNNALARVKGYTIILKNFPNDFTANYQMGLTWGKMLNNISKALPYLKKADSIEPENIELMRDLGVALAMNGNADEAIQYFLKCIEINPNEPSNFINLGMAYQQTGELAKARECFEKAKSLKQQ